MRSVVTQRIRRGEEQWTEIFQRFAASGLGSRAFCRKAGVSPSSFQRWRKRLAQGAGARFVELVPEATSAGRHDWTYELELPHGIVLRVRS